MSLILHREYHDGSFEHSEFSKESWEDALRDPAVRSRWGHREDDCHDPAARHWANLRERGWKCTPGQHALADKHDPTWAGSRQLGETPKIVPPPAEPVVWPPAEELTPQALCDLTTMCLTDARIVLWPPLKDDQRAREPIADKRGQYSLF